MKINKINMLSSYKQNEKIRTKSNVNIRPQINNFINLDSSAYNLFFKGSKTTVRLSPEEANSEKEIVQKARNLGVDTPEIQNDTYVLNGETANVNTNPITQRHIKNVLKNILIMDKAGFAHGDIEKAHVFYSKNGDVEFDCFRFHWTFDDSSRVEYEFPEFYSPTNLKQFEGNSLGEYLTQMDSEKRKIDFLNLYLENCSDFHSKKAQFIEESKLGTNEQVEYEKLQAEIFKNPDRDTTELFKTKIELLYNTRLAFTEWDEGQGACGHEIDDSRTTKAVQMYFSIISDIMEYIEKIQESKQAAFGNKLKYMEYEEKYAQHMLSKTIDSTTGMANWTINPENPHNSSYKNVGPKIRAEFQTMSDELKNCHLDDKTLKEKAARLKSTYSDILTANF